MVPTGSFGSGRVDCITVHKRGGNVIFRNLDIGAKMYDD